MATVKDAACVLVGMKLPQVIYLLIISMTMLNVRKFFWLINLISLCPQIGIVTYYISVLNNSSNSKLFPMVVAVDTTISFMYLFETLLQALDNFYNPSTGGKIFANIVGLVIFLVNLRYFHIVSDDYDENEHLQNQV